MDLICDICSNGYALYKQHEAVSRAFSTPTADHAGSAFKPQICYHCARRIDSVVRKCFTPPLPEENP